MNVLLKNSILFFIALLMSAGLVAQTKSKPERVKLERADVLEGGEFEGRRVSKFKGNVTLRHGRIILYCDSAYQYDKKQERNTIEAFGNVRIQQGNAITLTGDRLTFIGDKKRAIISGNVILKKGKRVKQYNSLTYKFK